MNETKTLVKKNLKEMEIVFSCSSVATVGDFDDYDGNNNDSHDSDDDDYDDGKALTMQNAISINNYVNSQASKQSSTTTAFRKLE